MLHSAHSLEKNKSIALARKSKLNQSIAIIDLGTNSVRFDVYLITQRGPLRVHREKIMIRLGDGVFESGRLSTDAMARGLRAFQHFHILGNELKADRVVAFGTSALRSASNAKTFIERVYERTKIRIKVISGKEEGALIALGIFENEKLPDGRLALVDIGGGSTEVTLSVGHRVQMQKSFKLGANRLQQMFFKKYPPELKRGALHPVLALRQCIRETLGKPSGPVKNVIGSSGTIRTLGRILKKLGYGRNNKFDRRDLSALVAEMCVMSRAELLKLPGLEPKRVDLILSGAILLEELLFFLGAKSFQVTEFALRDGILVKSLRAIK